MIRTLFIALFLLCGTVATAQNYNTDSTVNGRYYELDDSRTVRVKGYFKDTLRHRVWREYDAQGIITRKIKYRRGRVIWVNIYRNGILYQTIDRKGRIRTRSNCGC